MITHVSYGNVNNVTACTSKIWLSYSLSFLFQIEPDLCKLGINVNLNLCATIASFQIVNDRSFFRDMALLVTTVK